MPRKPAPETFSEKNARFFSRFSDPSVFRCAEFNLLKVAQHAVVRDKAFLSHNYFLLPIPVISFLLFIRRWRTLLFGKSASLDTLSKLNGRECLLVDVPRNLKNEQGEHVSVYFDKIIKEAGRERVIFVQGTLGKTPVNYDLHFSQVYDAGTCAPLKEDDIQLLKALKETFLRVKKETCFTSGELKRFAGALEIFWRQYRTWRELLKDTAIKKAILISHYQREYLILALRRKNIPVYELQHGLIFEEDIFYVYPPEILRFKNECLFPDKIFVFGNFWKRKLMNGSEFSDSQVVVAGDFLTRKESGDGDFRTFLKTRDALSKQLILVTVQKNMEAHFEKYIRWLNDDIHAKNQAAFIVVKPHPLGLKSLAGLAGLRHVSVATFDLGVMMRASSAHVSVYSTTLFDALLYKVKRNFSLHHQESSGYVDEMLKSGVCRLLGKKDNPLDCPYPPGTDLSGEEVYASFNPVRLMKEF